MKRTRATRERNEKKWPRSSCVAFGELKAVPESAISGTKGKSLATRYPLIGLKMAVRTDGIRQWGKPKWWRAPCFCAHFAIFVRFSTALCATSLHGTGNRHGPPARKDTKKNKKNRQKSRCKPLKPSQTRQKPTQTP